MSDFIRNLYERRMEHGTSGVVLHKAYVDEVQDFTLVSRCISYNTITTPLTCCLYTGGVTPSTYYDERS